MLKQFFRGKSKANGSGNGRPEAASGTSHNPTHLIDLHQVVKAFVTPVGDFIALNGLDLQIDRGEFVAVVGKSGSGKTTLINMITGIDRPTSGLVHIDGTAVHTLKEGPMAEWRGRTVGVIFQFFQLLPMLSCVENIMLPMDFCNVYNLKERQERALHLLEQVDMADQAYKLPSEISGGQQQRVAIARALANDPPILAADEPTGNLDSKTADAIFKLFQNLVANGKTILMVTHDNELASRVTRTIVIADGLIVDEIHH
jgi:putative ABC transport system ATP-binding protein